MTETETTTTDTERKAKANRIRESLALAQSEVEATEKQLEKSREKRRKLILMGREGGEKGENPLSYDEMAAATGLTKSAVYKIVRDGFRDPTLGSQKAAAER